MRRCCTFPLTTQAASGFRRCSSAWPDQDSLMVEGAWEVISAFLSQRLVNQVVLTIAPCSWAGTGR